MSGVFLDRARKLDLSDAAEMRDAQFSINFNKTVC